MSGGDEGKYREQYSIYATRYDTSERSVKRWVALGRINADRTPLDEPSKMREWWARNSNQRCPDRFLVADIEERKANVAEPLELVCSKPRLPAPPELELPIQQQKPAAVAAPVFVPRDLTPVADDEIGIEATLRRLQQAEVHTNRIYEKALIDGNDAQAKLAQKMFLDLAYRVAQVEKMAIEHRRQTGDLIPRNEVEIAIGDFHQEFHNLLRSSADRFFRAFGISISAENEAKWQLMIDETCEQLQQEVLAEPS